jgi:hypothetical protein
MLILHHTSFDGGLYWTCPIGNFSVSSDLNIAIFLCHETKLNSFSNTLVSYWSLAGLETHITHDRQNNIIWTSLTGARIRFKKSICFQQNTIENQGYRLTINSNKEYYLLDTKFRKWFYVNGQLRGIQMADGSNFAVVSEDGIIRAIYKNDSEIFRTRILNSTLSICIGCHMVAQIIFDNTTKLVKTLSLKSEKQMRLNFFMLMLISLKLPVPQKHFMSLHGKRLTS